MDTGCSDDDCKNVPRYTPSDSLVRSTANFKLNYLLGSVRGMVGSETVTLGQFQVTSQVFGNTTLMLARFSAHFSLPGCVLAMANQTMGLHLHDGGHSGIMGLAFPIEASIPTSTGQPLLANLFSHFDDAQKFFALKLSRDTAASSFTLGQLDNEVPGNISDFVYMSVYPRANASNAAPATFDYWKLPLHALALDNVSIPLSPSKVSGAPMPIAVLDTGTTLVLGPRADVDTFWTTVGGAKKEKDGWWHVNCARGVVVSFVLGDYDMKREYPVDPQDLSWEEGGKDREWCLGGIQANDGVRLLSALVRATLNLPPLRTGELGGLVTRRRFPSSKRKGPHLVLTYGLLHALQNVYVTHHYTQPPKIGLLSTTDPIAALSAFRETRGTDAAAPVQSVHAFHAIVGFSHPGTAAIYTSSLIAGFAGGALAMFLGLRVRRATSGSQARRQ